MTVTPITKDKLDEIISNMETSDMHAMSIRLTEDEVKQTSEDTWRTIREEISKLDDMTYTCIKDFYLETPVKKFMFTGANRSQLIQVTNFIDEMVCNRKVTTIADTSIQFAGTYGGSSGGVGANCPLFK